MKGCPRALHAREAAAIFARTVRSSAVSRAPESLRVCRFSISKSQIDSVPALPDRAPDPRVDQAVILSRQPLGLAP